MSDLVARALRFVRPGVLAGAPLSWGAAYLIQDVARPSGWPARFNPLGYFDWGPSFHYALGFAFLFLAFRSRTPRANAAWVIVGALGYETLQALIPERTVDPADFVATVAALPVALAVHALAARRDAQRQ